MNRCSTSTDATINLKIKHMPMTVQLYVCQVTCIISPFEGQLDAVSILV